MLQFNMWQSQQNAQWYFNIKGGNGEKIVQSEGYTTRQSAAHTVDLIRGSAGSSAVYEYRNGQWVKIV